MASDGARGRGAARVVLGAGSVGGWANASPAQRQSAIGVYGFR
jgi:hypothetical protein